MLTSVENYKWLTILAVFVLLFMVIWNALKSSSIFPEPTCFVISLCVAALCILGVTNYFPKKHVNLQEVAVIAQEDVSLQEPQQRKFFFILLPYMALVISLLLFLIITLIAPLANGVSSLFRPSYGNNKDKIITTDRQKKKDKYTTEHKLFREKNT
jgi:hypothetical protein